jgi:hypothetical protein
VHPEYTEPPELARKLARQSRALKPVTDVGHNTIPDECADDVADVAFVI